MEAKKDPRVSFWNTSKHQGVARGVRLVTGQIPLHPKGGRIRQALSAAVAALWVDDLKKKFYAKIHIPNAVIIISIQTATVRKNHTYKRVSIYMHYTARFLSKHPIY